MRGHIHSKPHPLKGKRVRLAGQRGESPYTVMDWFDRETGSTWQDLRGNNKVATGYANRRQVIRKLPKDDEVVILYDHRGSLLAVHTTEIKEI